MGSSRSRFVGDMSRGSQSTSSRADGCEDMGLEDILLAMALSMLNVISDCFPDPVPEPRVTAPHPRSVVGLDSDSGSEHGTDSEDDFLCDVLGA
ncbi:hypothetical protein NLI96_g8821 [Meripilus lineatus]|uniref:Uncharacterized protein n=1 Tax=Meripilus lineatus TaxID=2056292 RepID=A0AAD5UWQ8_9APHY|nr:hypothetical protein NLI96_g8821 [Physisporinus lineatus]